MVILTGLLTLCLAAVHLFGGRMRFLAVTPRSRWLSAAGGISVAYVFVHVLPDLAAHQRALGEAARGTIGGLLEHHVYLVALFGLMAFYGLERLAKLSRGRRAGSTTGADGDGDAEDEATGGHVFWIHVGSFALYNVLIGYLLLHREGSDRQGLMLFFAAMATHFLVNDAGLRQHHQRRYDAVGRWLLAAAALVGWALGATVELHPAALATCFAFVAGGVILNVLKEELPEERQSTFWAFAVGAVAYATLLLVA